MGTLWRSQAMELCELFVQTSSAYDAAAALGDLGLLQFIDSNEGMTAFARRFAPEIRMCEDIERQLRILNSELERATITPSEGSDDVPVPPARDLFSLSEHLSTVEARLKSMDANDLVVKKQESELIELRHVLASATKFFADAEAGRVPSEDDEPGQIKHVTGVIPFANLNGFELLLWRACRGNVFLIKSADVIELEDFTTKKSITKIAFIAFYQGSQLETRIRKICDGYDARMYNCSSNPIERAATLTNLNARLTDIETVIARSTQFRRTLLDDVSSKISQWTINTKKVKGIYHVLNMFKNDARQCLVAQCWCPTAEIGNVQAAISKVSTRDSPSIIHAIPTHQKRPTFHKTSKFTDGFQSIIDAYGMADYQEVNPAPFTVITFPFLFAVMFGDYGHGFLMTLAALMMIIYEKKLFKFDGGEIWSTMFGGRYIMFFMGLFSIYTGFIYNDCFSKPVSFMPSGWTISSHANTTDELVTLDLIKDFDYAYPIGIDPIWQMADNKLTFGNSFKMKMSVILGVIHMMFGIILSLFNHVYFRRYMNIYFEFIPQILFLGCIFGYLVAMIFFKWANTWLTPPSLLVMLINMFLSFGSKPAAADMLYGSDDGTVQSHVQSGLVVTAVLCIPVMLLFKPLLLRSINKKPSTNQTAGMNHSHIQRDDDGLLNYTDDPEFLLPHHTHPRHTKPLFFGLFGVQGVPGGDSHGDHGEFNFGEVMVHQAIHTIEFCLGCISNTASYLRLWALSLAHAQLSEVLWEMVMHNGLSQNAFFLFCAFSVWAVLTVGVLLIMEGLSAFLHALRLHWVEFQNKFYGGNGVKFLPFSFYQILNAKLDE